MHEAGEADASHITCRRNLVLPELCHRVIELY